MANSAALAASFLPAVASVLAPTSAWRFYLFLSVLFATVCAWIGIYMLALVMMAALCVTLAMMGLSVLLFIAFICFLVRYPRASKCVFSLIAISACSYIVVLISHACLAWFRLIISPGGRADTIISNYFSLLASESVLLVSLYFAKDSGLIRRPKKKRLRVSFATPIDDADEEELERRRERAERREYEARLVLLREKLCKIKTHRDSKVSMIKRPIRWMRSKCKKFKAIFSSS